MRKILLLATTSIRKSKSQTVTLSLLLMVSTMVLAIGAIVMVGFGSFFDRTAKELNTSDAVFVISEGLYIDEMTEYFEKNASEFETTKGVRIGMSFLWNGTQIDWSATFVDMAASHELSQWKLVGDSIEAGPDAIYVPYLYKVVGGYGLGDELVVTIYDQAYRFTVAGYLEGIWHDRNMLGDMAAIPSARYQEMVNLLPRYSQVIVYANGIDANRAESDLMDLTAEYVGLGAANLDFDNTIVAADYDGVKNWRVLMATVMSGMMVVFTFVVVGVCSLVIRYRISNSIEEDLPRIGSLKAIGYTSNQITASVMAQYGVIAFVASAIGVVSSYLLLPTVTELLATQSGMLWQPGAQPALNAAAVAVITAVVALVGWMAARSVRRHHVVEALRGGIATHSYKRDPLPLSRSRLPLTLSLASKAMLQGMRSTVTTLSILLAVSITATVAVILFYNSTIDISAFEKVPGIERANSAMNFAPGQDAIALCEEVESHPDVRLAQYMDWGRARVGGIDTPVVVMVDFSQRATDNIYAGVAPRYYNEIAISGPLATSIGKGIGDEVLVGRDSFPYIVTGLVQGMEAGGTVSAYLTLDGMRLLEPGFQQVSLMIYLNPGVDAAEYTTWAQKTFEGRALVVIDGDASFAEGVSSFATIMSLVGVAIMVIVMLIVVLVLFLVISSTIIRKRRELGIYKAIGYTTASLMNQISFSLVIPIALGVAAGCLIGGLATNAMMSIAMAGAGVAKANLIVEPVWVAGTGVAIVIIAYLAGLLFTRRIRRISAYQLVTE